MSHAKTKLNRMQELKRFMLQNPSGIHPDDVVEKLEVDRSTVYRLLNEIGAEQTYRNSGLWIWIPGQSDIELAKLVLASADYGE